MSNDNEKFRNQAVLSFSDLRNKKEDDTEEPVLKEVTKEDVMQTKIMTARVHANKEIKQFKTLVETFSEEVEKLVLFRSVGDTVKSICIEQVLESIIDPILKGFKPVGMQDTAYREMRTDLYKSLINRYVDEIGEGTNKE
jgi:hypothetical protein